ncbi:protein-L-isoaspartate(D-aspartate) O-methyltransferase [Streptomyces sp. NPDC005840]|uniref:protein-L-isoaspartate(D-aspartate) O-methyltransferase n=1 Tax=Streptomyces sp. NPDC005840 TaxID=3157072 RepID=UPI0033FA174A
MRRDSLTEGRSILGRSLAESGALAPEWQEAFDAVPRAAFLPDVVWAFDMDTGAAVEADRRTDPTAWQRYVDQDVPIVTQWDDGAGEGPGGEATSSASMPSVVFRMLADLDARPGDSVLEIGTGTGWTAGLMTHRLGHHTVTSIEVDGEVAAAARGRLGAQGLLVTVLTRDGTEGDPPGAPYARLISTVGLRRVPTVWLEQVSPDGLIVAPWGTHYGNGDAVVRLRVSDGGGCASGHFTRPVEFMKLRAQRRRFDGHRAYVPDGLGGADRSTTDVAETDVLGADRYDARTFASGLRVPDCYQVRAAARDGRRPVWFYGLGDRSWACVMFHEGRTADVWQSGPRCLWDEVASALDWWREKGEPGYERFGLTVTDDGGHRAWLDDPDDAWPV